MEHLCAIVLWTTVQNTHPPLSVPFPIGCLFIAQRKERSKQYRDTIKHERRRRRRRVSILFLFFNAFLSFYCLRHRWGGGGSSSTVHLRDIEKEEEGCGDVELLPSCC